MRALTWLGIVVAGILLLTAYKGFRRGFIREIVSFFFVFLALAVSWAINPYVNEFFMENTPVYEKIQESCQSFVESQKKQELTSPGTEEQTGFIEGLELPELLQKGLESNNTAEVYTYLAVDSFGEYISEALARMIVNGLSFFVSYLLASVILRLGTWVLNLLAGLPVLKSANKLAGGLVGAVKGVLFVWIAFLVMTILCSTSIGKEALALIEKDAFLNVLYEYDIFVNVFMSIFYGM
ncbi:MAG: CvpA family protein [Blautia caecimuris]|jgi:uncharacterized membrane protein required for colicin V production|uniref:CvpA family protein n=1 Tax=Blautia TaxID=572511 RepID=UPI0011C7C188|nr:MULTISPECIES: CvpA family protein [Blautia]MBS7173838.1 CvpA family protein [Blautia sp.]NSG68347.1 CvpA family protein [Blautia caecimuris]